MRRSSKLIAYFCLLLILGSAAVVIAHHHPGGVDDGKCMVCALAHTASVILLAPASNRSLVTVARLIAWPERAARQRLIVFALTVRPPPVS